VPDVVSPSSKFQVEVKVTNTGAGDSVPTGFTAERQVVDMASASKAISVSSTKSVMKDKNANSLVHNP
jgi:hypothetical protein